MGFPRSKCPSKCLMSLARSWPVRLSALCHTKLGELRQNGHAEEKRTLQNHMLARTNHEFNACRVAISHLLNACNVELSGENPASTLCKGTTVVVSLFLVHYASGTLGTVGSARLSSLSGRISLRATR